MPKTEEYLHHQPRKIDKKKKRAPQRFNEDPDSRKTRINFKSYIREVREQELLDDELYGDDE